MLLSLAGCGAESSPGSTGAPIVIDTAGRAGTVDFRKRAHDSEHEYGFHETVDYITGDWNVRQVEVKGIPGVVGFRVRHADAEESLALWNEEGRDNGSLVIRYHNSLGRGKDSILVFPTLDEDAVVLAVNTRAVRYEWDARDVVALLDGVAHENPFYLTEAGSGYVAARFVVPPTPPEARALARRLYRVDPDIVNHGTGTVAALAKSLEKGDLYLRWD